MRKNEQKRIEAKKAEWDRILRPVDRFWVEFTRRSRILYKQMMDWYFFYKAESKGDKALHIIQVLIVDLFLFRFFGLI